MHKREGKPLAVSASIGKKYSKSITAVMQQMHKEIMLGIQQCYEAYAQDADDTSKEPDRGSLISQFRILLNRLSEKYEKAFSYLSRVAVNRMVERVVKNSETTLNLSLKEISQGVAVKPNFLSPKLRDIVKAVTIDSTNKIKLIPQNHIAVVQTTLFDSITTGKGFKDIKAALIKHYKGDERRAELTALDQTRKAYRSIQAERLKGLGVKKFKWIHTGGGRDPRKLHQELSGKIFSFEDPPYIGDMYGQKVYGLPGELPNCRCMMRPVFDFEVT